MKEFIGLSAKIYSHSKDNNDEDKKKQKAQKVCCKKVKFQD